MIVSKRMNFEIGKQISRNTLDFFPKELLKCFKPLTKEVVTGKGKNKKVEIVNDENVFECVKSCSFFFTIKIDDNN